MPGRGRSAGRAKWHDRAPRRRRNVVAILGRRGGHGRRRRRRGRRDRPGRRRCVASRVVAAARTRGRRSCMGHGRAPPRCARPSGWRLSRPVPPGAPRSSRPADRPRVRRGARKRRSSTSTPILPGADHARVSASAVTSTRSSDPRRSARSSTRSVVPPGMAPTTRRSTQVDLASRVGRGREAGGTPRAPVAASGASVDVRPQPAERARSHAARPRREASQRRGRAA